MSIQPSPTPPLPPAARSEPQPTLFSPYTLGDIALEQPAGAVADDAQPRARRQCREPAGCHLLRAARVGRPDDHRRHAGQPAGRRLHPHAWHPFARAGRRLEAHHRRGPSRRRHDLRAALACRPRLASGFPRRRAAGRRRPRCRSTAKPSPTTARSRSRRRARSRPARSAASSSSSARARRTPRRPASTVSNCTAPTATCSTSSCATARTGAPTRYGGSVSKRACDCRSRSTEAVVGVFGASRVGYKLSPYFAGYSMSDSNPVATFTYIAKELGKLGLGYLHVSEAIAGTDEGRRHRARDAADARCVRRHADRQRRL